MQNKIFKKLFCRHCISFYSFPAGYQNRNILQFRLGEKKPCKNANTYFEQNMFIIEIIKVDSLDFITYDLFFVFKKKNHKSSIKEITILIINVFIY